MESIFLVIMNSLVEIKAPLPEVLEEEFATAEPAAVPMPELVGLPHETQNLASCGSPAPQYWQEGNPNRLLSFGDCPERIFEDCETSLDQAVFNCEGGHKSEHVAEVAAGVD